MGQLLNTFSCIAKKGSNVLLIKSKKCKICTLCGKYSNYKNMIDENNYIKIDENRIIDINSKLNCKFMEYILLNVQNTKRSM